MSIQQLVGYVNIVLITILILNLYELGHFELRHLVVVGFLQDIFTAMPLGWHILQLLAALLILEQLQKFYLSFTLRNQIIIVGLTLLVAQLSLMLNFMVAGRTIIISYHVINYIAGFSLAVLAAAILKHYYVKLRVAN